MSGTDGEVGGGWLGIEAVRDARAAGAGLVRHTPVLSSRSLSDAAGGSVVLKAENLQRTGSFKLRGALARLHHHLPAAGVVAGSAGNHGQSLAYAARAHGVPCEVFMPGDAAVAKVAAVRGFGGTVHDGGASVDACVDQARAHAERTGAVFVHPFDDPRVVAGQGTLALELLEDVGDLATVIVPVGGGGLISGVAGVLAELAPRARVVGVQVDACAPFPASLRDGRVAEAASTATIADGIAIKRPGGMTLPLVQRWVDEVVTVSEGEVAEAMVLLMERAKLVVEGAGAVGVAALTSGAVRPARDGSTVVVLSGGNVDAGLLAGIANRHETEAGRRLRLFTRVADRPGGLAALLAAVAEAGGNLRTLEHVRDAVPLAVRDTGVELVMDTRGVEHSTRIVAALEEAGYEVTVHGGAGIGATA
ncbi:MAG TPA: threonine ammonia-lyase [Capillimicrobium sp.]